MAALNGHYSHFEALPARSFVDGDTTDLFTTAQFAPTAGSLLFTMGCHSGLNVPDIGVAAPNPAQQARLLDWAQAATGRGALYVGQSGFGYGDTEAVAYSERLLQYFAENLAARSMTAAQALMFAQQRYVGDLGVIGVYDAKIVEISTFYGLPMWRIGAGGTEAPSAMPADGASTGRLSTAQFAAAPDLEEVVSVNGSYWTANGELPQVTHFRPIQPRMTVDVPAGDGLTLHGAVIETLVSVDVPGVDPVYDRPVVDLGANEPERAASDVWFPAQIQAVQSYAGAAGQVDQLVLMPGQYFTDGSATGTQRLHHQIGGTAYRSDSDDWTAPAIRLVSGNVVNGGVTFEVTTPDTDVLRGVVLWRDDASNSLAQLGVARHRRQVVGRRPADGRRDPRHRVRRAARRPGRERRGQHQQGPRVRRAAGVVDQARA